MKNILLLIFAVAMYVTPIVASNRNIDLMNHDNLDVIVGHPHSIPIVEEDGKVTEAVKIMK